MRFNPPLQRPAFLEQCALAFFGVLLIACYIGAAWFMAVGFWRYLGLFIQYILKP